MIKSDSEKKREKKKVKGEKSRCLSLACSQVKAEGFSFALKGFSPMIISY